MSKDSSRVQKENLYIGSGVEDILDESLHTKINEFGQFNVNEISSYVKTSKLDTVVLNSEKSLNEDQISLKIFNNTKNMYHQEKIGYYFSLYAGHVSKGDYRKNGSSGGLVTWVASELLRSGEIDGFIHVKKSSNKDLLFEYGVSRTIDEIRSGSKSRYYPAQLSEVLKTVKSVPGKYAVVGIPEIITELRLLAENDRIIKERIVYYLGLVAGHQKTTKYAEAIAWEYGIKPGDLEDIDFRVKRESGKSSDYDMSITGKVNGVRRKFIIDRAESFVSSWAHGFFKARFSDFTDNALNENADIAFGDAWLDKYAADSQGDNIVIVRNPVFKKLIQDGIADGRLVLDSIDAETLLRSQTGLIRHTRDELPYRLAKLQKKSKWTLVKRTVANNTLDVHRAKIQDVRTLIAEKSHIYYREAVKRNDFNYFKKKMQPHVDTYNKLYGQVNTHRYRPVVADGAILTLTGYFNYGNVIQRYALQKFLQKNGQNFVSYVDSYSAPRAIYKHNKRVYLKTPFRVVKRFLKYQKPFWYIPKFGDIYEEANRQKNIIQFVNENIWIKLFDARDDYKTYIVGSDQVWRNWWGNRSVLGYYFFNFLKGRKANRIAYAASFGKDRIEDVMSSSDAEYITPYIGMFNAVSVREKSGERIVRERWGVETVDTVVDPTLLLEATDYSALIEKSIVKFAKIEPIFAYIISENKEMNTFLTRIQDTYHQALTKVRAHGGAENDVLPPVELWLKGFRDAELVITNSFHGMMFSIINKTDFIILGRESGGLSRINDFLLEYGIGGRFVDEDKLAEFDLSTLKPINWKAVNKKLTVNRKQSAEWLLNSVRK